MILNRLSRTIHRDIDCGRLDETLLTALREELNFEVKDSILISRRPGSDPSGGPASAGDLELDLTEHRAVLAGDRRAPLARAVWLRNRTGPDALVLVVHHLVVDAVSWGILEEDLDGTSDPSKK